MGMEGFAMFSGFMIGVIGLVWFVDKLAKKETRRKLTMPLLVLLLGFVLLLGGVSNVTIVSFAEAQQDTALSKITEDSIMELASSIELTPAEAAQVLLDLNTAGIESVSDIKKEDIKEESGAQSFTAVADGKPILLLIRDRKTEYVGIGSIALFDRNKGGAVNQLADCGLREEEAAAYMAAAEEYIGYTAKYPDSVRFPSHTLKADKWTADRYKNIVEVESYVDAKNGMGAMRRSTFVIQLAYDTKNCLFISLNGDTLYGEYTNLSD